MTPEPVNPWALLEACSKVYCVSSQLGFEGLMAGCEVCSFGKSFYAGWGVTRDTAGLCARRSLNNIDLEIIFSAMYLDYIMYIDVESNCLSEIDSTVRKISRRIDI